MSSKYRLCVIQNIVEKHHLQITTPKAGKSLLYFFYQEDTSVSKWPQQ